jgi:hypothetical protein
VTASSSGESANCQSLFGNSADFFNPFAFYAAAIAGERTVRADHPMTRHDHANRIGPIGQTDRSNGLGTSELRAQIDEAT